eukprot:1722610-Rhodomonas_salina.1
MLRPEHASHARALLGASHEGDKEREEQHRLTRAEEDQEGQCLATLLEPRPPARGPATRPWRAGGPGQRQSPGPAPWCTESRLLCPLAPPLPAPLSPPGAAWPRLEKVCPAGPLAKLGQTWTAVHWVTACCETASFRGRAVALEPEARQEMVRTEVSDGDGLQDGPLVELLHRHHVIPILPPPPPLSLTPALISPVPVPALVPARHPTPRHHAVVGITLILTPARSSPSWSAD